MSVGHSRNTTAVAGALLCLTVVASIVVFAVQADGREGNESTTNDGGAWLVNQRAGSIGHVNREVKELSAAVRVGEPGSSFEVMQPQGAVVVHDRTLNSLEVVDQRTHLRNNTITLPPGSVVEKYATGIVVTAQSPFRVWRFESSELTSLQTLDAVTPLYEADLAPVWAVSATGDVAVDDVASGAVVIVGSDGPEQIWTRSGAVSAILFDGDRPIVRIDDRIGVADGDRIEMRNGDVERWAATQQPTVDESGSFVVAATSGNVLLVDTGSGDSDIIGELPGDDPSSLIQHRGCVFAVTNSPANFWRQCGKTEARVTALSVSPTARLQLRLVNGWVWINDLSTGHLWVVDDALELSEIEDWGAVLPQEANPEDLEISAVESDDDVIEDVENPDAADAFTVDSDQFDEDGINQPPVAFDDDETETHKGRAVLVDVVGNDEDGDNDVLLISKVENLSGSDATVQAAADGTTVQVTPAPDFEGVVRFSYTVTDGRGGSDSAIGSVTVRSRSGEDNRPPVAVTDIGSITVGERLIINVLTNDYDPDGDSLVLVSASAPQGNVTFDGSGQIVFEPDSISEEGEIVLDYLVSDDFGEISEGRVRASVRLRDSNQPPDARNDGGLTVVGQPITLNLLANDSDPDGDDLFVTQRPELLSPPDIDVFTTITTDGEFVFIPDAAGTYLFSYGASDQAATDLAQIRVEVEELSGNQPPVAVRDDIVIPSGESRIVYALQNDGDPDGDVVGIVDFNVTPGSGLRVEAFGEVGFRVFADEQGLPRRIFRYSISDGENAPVETVVVVAVAESTSINQPPFAQADTVDIRPGASVVVPVLDNDFDPEGGPLRVVDVSQIVGSQTAPGPAAQSVRIAVSASTVTSFTLTYDVIDDHDNRTAATIRVRVVPSSQSNRPPIARPDAARTPFEKPIAVKVVLNDSDPDGDAIRVESITAQPLHGIATVDDATGDVLYEPADDFSGTDRFSYVLVDALGARTEGEVLIGVMPEPRPNRDPVAEDDLFITVATGQKIDLPVLINDRDPDGDQLRLVDFESPAIGRVDRSLDGRLLTYQAPIEQSQDEQVSFGYTVSDGAGGSDTATIVIVVQATPERAEGAPIAVDDEIGPVPTGELVTVEVVANDSDPDGPSDELVVAVFDTALRVEGQTVVFVAPDVDAEFAYQITDVDGNQDAGIIAVSVVNARPPVALDDQFGPVTQGDVVDIPVLLNDYSLDASPAAGEDPALRGLEIVGVTGEGAVAGDGFVRVTAPAESSQYTYTIRDRNGLEAVATISLIVTANRAPVIAPQSVSTPFQEPIEIDLSLAATDPDGDVLLYSCCQTTQNGSPSVLDAGEGVLLVEFTPDDSFSGDAVFSFEVNDQFGNIVAGSVTVVVEEQPNRPPTAVDADVEIQVPRPNAPSVSVDLDLAPLTDDPDDDALVWTIESPPSNGIIASIDGSILVLSATDQSAPGTATMGWTATDVEGASVTGTVEVAIAEPQNEPPSASDSTVPVPAGATATVDLATLVTDNDADEVLSYEIGSLTDGSITATLTGDSTVTFAASITATGDSTTLDYAAIDRMGENGPAVITVEVGEPDVAPPVAQPDDAGTLQEIPVSVAVLANDQDPLGGGLTVVDPGFTNDGSVALDGSAITFTPLIGFFGTTSFTYTIADAAAIESRQSSATVTVEVIGRPDVPSPPTCTPDAAIAALTWTEPANNGAPVAGYDVEHDQGGAEPLGNSTNYTWEELVNGTTYRFRIAARNEAGASDFSEWSLPCTPDIEPRAPAQPEVTHGDGFLIISWSEPDNNGSRILDYDVRMVGGRSVRVEGEFEYKWEPLENGENHTFEVAARNAKGLSEYSIPSSPEHPSKVPSAPTIKPTTRAGLLGALASGTLQVNWTPVPVSDDGGDPISHYVIERRPSSEPRPIEPGANADHYIWSGLRNGESFEFRVIAVNRDGEGQPSAWSPVIQPCTVPDPPTNVVATRGDKQAVVTYGAPADDGGCDIVSYEVRRASGGGGAVTDPEPPDPVTMGGLENGDPYSFEVRAVNTHGESSWVGSNRVTPAGPPICPDASYRVRSIDRSGTTLEWSSANFNGTAPGYYERTGSSGEPHNVGSGNVETLPAWSPGTHTLELEAVNEIGRDSCGSVTFTTCPATPPQMPAPPIGANQIIKRIALPNLALPANYIACLSQAEVGASFQIEKLQVESQVLSGGGTVLTNVAIGDDVIYGPGLPPGYEVRSHIRACYPGNVCGTWSAWTPATRINPEVTLSQGNRRARDGCNFPCDDLVVNLAGFRANESVTITSATNGGRTNWCGTWIVTVNSSGSGSDEEHCWFGYWGETVWVVANGIQSNGVLWAS